MKHSRNQFAELESLARVVITARAKILLESLKERHGPLLFHQSGGCCEGSVPLCLLRDEFRVGARDVLLDVVDGTPFYVDESHFRLLGEEKLLLDAVASESDSFSLECADGMRFIATTLYPAACPAGVGLRDSD